MNKLIIPLFFTFFIILSINVVSCDNFGNNETVTYIDSSPIFKNNNFGFISYFVNLDTEFSIIGANWKSYGNETYYMQELEHPFQNDRVAFIWKYNEELDLWKLSIEGYTTRNRAITLRFSSNNTVLNGTELIFNNVTYFDWSDSPSYFTYLGFSNGYYRLRLNIKTGNFNIDPTFGRTDAGGSNTNIEGAVRGSKFTFSGGNSYQADSITAFLKTATAFTYNVTCGLYSGSSLVAQTEIREITFTTTYTEYTFSFSSPPSLTNNTEYTLVAWANSLSNTIYLAYTSVIPFVGVVDTETWDGTLPNPASFTVLARNCSIYCTYSEISSGTNYEIIESANIDITLSKLTLSNFTRNYNGNIDISTSKLIQSNFIRNVESNIEIFAFKLTQSNYIRNVEGNINILVSKITQSNYYRTFEEPISIFSDLIINIGEMLNIFITFIYDNTIAKLWEYTNNTLIENYTVVEMIYNSELKIYTSPINSSLYEFSNYYDNSTYVYDNPYILLFDNNKTVYVNMLSLIEQMPLGTELFLVLGILLMIFGIHFILYITNFRSKSFSILCYLIGLIVNIGALIYPIPFTPFIQFFFIFAESILLYKIYSRS